MRKEEKTMYEDERKEDKQVDGKRGECVGGRTEKGGKAMYEREKKSGTGEWKREGKERKCMGKKSVSRQVERGRKIRRQSRG